MKEYSEKTVGVLKELQISVGGNNSQTSDTFNFGLLFYQRE